MRIEDHKNHLPPIAYRPCSVSFALGFGRLSQRLSKPRFVAWVELNEPYPKRRTVFWGAKKARQVAEGGTGGRPC